MGTVLKFPVERRALPPRRRSHGSDTAANVVILPAVRIERMVEPDPHPSQKPPGRLSAWATERGPSWP
jgi:hypothetical protein